MEHKKRCFNCRYFATQDEGYSNYTVENTVVHCMKKLNPAFPMDESYSWNDENSNTKDHEIVKFAETCSGYVYSDTQIRLDVDGDDTIEDVKADAELYEVARLYFES
ncbi:MAG: hypothetical protein ACYC7L_17205 [Nitrospirota bacterium]